MRIATAFCRVPVRGRSAARAVLPAAARAIRLGAYEAVFSEGHNLAASGKSIIAAGGQALSNRDSSDDWSSYDSSAEGTMLSRIGEIQTPLPASQAMLIGLMAAIVVYARTLWNIVNHAETVVHEGAHALAGIVTGRRVRSVKIDAQDGGRYHNYVAGHRFRVRRCRDPPATSARAPPASLRWD